MAFPTTPEYEFEVSIDPENEWVESGMSTKVPVSVKIVCVQYTPNLTVGSQWFFHSAKVTAAGRVIETTHKEKTAFSFAPEHCLNEIPRSYTFDVSFRIPPEIGAATPVAISVQVRPEDGIGNGSVNWNSSVAIVGDVDVSHGVPGSISSISGEPAIPFQVWNHLNGNISGRFWQEERHATIFVIEDKTFGPVPARSAISDELNFSVASSFERRDGEWSSPVTFQYWLSDHPEVMTHTEEVPFGISIKDDTSTKYTAEADAGGFWSILLVVAALAFARCSRHGSTHRRPSGIETIT